MMEAHEGKVSCPCCGKSAEQFLPMGPPGRQRLNAKCPHCGSLERHRLLILFFKTQENLFPSGIKLLHVAPEPPLAKWITSHPTIEYLSGDISDPRAMIKLDLTNIQFDDNTFNAIVCNHVLEHVPDDRKALAEIYRVMRSGGWAILISPINPNLQQTREDPSVTDPAERERLFGQHDHVRWYGKDYADRLKEPGFDVQVIPYARQLSDREVQLFGLHLDEDIYLCMKP